MKSAYRIVSDFAEIERRKVAERLAFLALSPEVAQRQVDLGQIPAFRESDAEGVGLGSRLIGEEDGCVDK